MKFSPHNAKLVTLIASIYPWNTWHPRYTRCMQQGKWLNFLAISQYHELYIVSNAMKAHYKRLESFHENQPRGLFGTFLLRDDYVLERNAQRVSYFFLCNSSWQPFGTNRLDVQYPARDLVGYGLREHCTYTAATIVCLQTAITTIREEILSMAESWTNVSGEATLSLQYTRSWLAPNLPSIWLQAYNLLQRGDEGKWYQLLSHCPPWHIVCQTSVTWCLCL